MSQTDQEPIEVDNTNVRPQRKWTHVSIWEVLIACMISALLISIIFPSSSNCYHRQRTACASNLGSIGRACLIYADRNNGIFPSSLDVLLEGGDQALLQPQQLVCPKSKIAYIYIPGQHYMYDARNVIAYELISNHQGQGAYVTYLDSHCSWSTPEMLQEELADTYARLAKAATRAAE